MNRVQSLNVSPDSDQEKLLKFEQVKLLYAAMPVSVLATLINAAVLVAVLWGVADYLLSMIWLAGLCIVTLARYGLSFLYHRTDPEVEQTAHWARYFSIGSIAAGAVWGSSSLLLFPESSVIHQVFVVFVVGGMCAGAITSLSPRLLPVFSFLLLALGPLVVRFFIIGTEVANAMGIMLCVFITMLLFSAHRTYQNLRQNILLTMQSQASEERFRELFEANKSAELIIDPDNGSIIEANCAAEDFYGYDREQLLSLNMSDISTLSGKSMDAEPTSSDREEQFVFQHRLANGEIRDVEVHSGPVHWNQRRALYSIIHDITERKRSEYFTKQSSEIFKMVASAVPAGEIYDAICHMYEEAYPRMRTSILKLKGNQLFHCSAPSLPEEYSKAIDGIEIGLSVGSCGTAAYLSKEIIVEDIATDPRWAAYKEVALPHDLRACWSEPIVGSDGSILGTFAMYFRQPERPGDNELTEIRNAAGLVAVVMERERRKALLNKFSQAIERAGESVMITDKEGAIEYVNPSFTRITGYSSEEVLGKNPRIIKSGIQTENYYKKLWDTITSGKVWHASIVDRRKDGSEYPAMMSIAPIFNEHGQISHYVGIQQDMTDHEALEEKFRQAQKMEALGTLVGGIAHDFNNMLGGITGNIYLAKRKVADMPDVIKKLENVETLSNRAAEMVKQLLAFARKDIVEMQPFGLTSFIQRVSEIIRSSIPENISFHSDVSHDELVVKGDATQLQQVLMNLLNNAQDAVSGVPEPTISLTLDEFEADEHFLTAHSGVSGNLFAHLVVKDNGIGISDEEKDHIFEPFYTTKEVGDGTGLGLAMSYGAIESHGGVLEVESTPGEGSSFHIYLPLLKEKKVDFEAEGIVEAASGNGELILIADDNADIRASVKEVLESLNYQVLEALDGLQAVDLFVANQSAIALIIMDVVMPRLGGVKAVRRIQALRPDAKVIFSTGYDKEEALKGEVPLDGYVILSKPYDVTKLSRTIREQLDS